MMNRSMIDTSVSQVATLMAQAIGDLREAPTPCSDWTVAQLCDHFVHGASQFATMARGAEVDWAASAAQLSDPIPAWDERSRELLAAIDAGGSLPLDMVAAEFSVHTWDLATALGYDTDDLDQSLAEDGLGFMSANLTGEPRGSSFDPEKAAPEGANAYERIAAFAGRSVR